MAFYISDKTTVDPLEANKTMAAKHSPVFNEATK